MGVEVIFRDHEGNVLANMCSSKPYIFDPIVVEAYAAWKVVEFSIDLGILNIILEGDVLEIVNALRIEGKV